MSVESRAQSAAVQYADSAVVRSAGSARMTMMQHPNTSGGNDQLFHMGVDSWFTEYAQCLKMGKDIENLMKKNKIMVKHVNYNYERNLTLVLISQRITKLWQILDRLDALGKNPDRTRITELQQTHRQKLLEEERSRITKMFMDFQEFHALSGQASRPEKIQNNETQEIVRANNEHEERVRANSEREDRFRPSYYTGMGLAEILSPDQRGLAEILSQDQRMKGVTSAAIDVPWPRSGPSTLW